MDVVEMVGEARGELVLVKCKPSRILILCFASYGAVEDFPFVFHFVHLVRSASLMPEDPEK